MNAVDSDSVWFTCCVLHNWLLELDGLTDKWVGGVRKVVSGPEGDLGCLDFKGVPVEVPNALARLSASLDPRNYDSSGLGPGRGCTPEFSRAKAKIRVLVPRRQHTRNKIMRAGRATSHSPPPPVYISPKPYKTTSP